MYTSESLRANRGRARANAQAWPRAWRRSALLLSRENDQTAESRAALRTLLSRLTSSPRATSLPGSWQGEGVLSTKARQVRRLRQVRCFLRARCFLEQLVG